MFSQKVTRISFSIAFSIVLLMWLVFAMDYLLSLKLYRYGLHPGEWSGLWGVFTSPFLHSTADIGHLLNNSLPMFILTWLLFYHYREIATKSFLLIFFLSGIGTWILGSPNYHIGMSGVIYGLTGFLVFSGFFRKSMRVAAISLFVIFLYGSMIWGVLPIKAGVSWEGHLAGLIGGIIVAILFKRTGPQPDKLGYEIEEELGIEPSEQYWREDYLPTPPVNPIQSPVQIIQYTYTYIPEKKDSPSEDEKGGII